MLATGGYCLVLVFAWQTFDRQGIVSASVVLNSYSSEDLPMRMARVAVAASILCSFPLMFNGFRDSSTGLLLGATECLQSINLSWSSALNMAWAPSRYMSTALLMVPVFAA